MRKGYLFLAGAGAVLLAACSGDKKASINDDLKKDLELASSSDGITLANSSANASQQVVSAIEQTAAPKARKQAASTRVRSHKAAPKAPPQVVRAQAPATVVETEPRPSLRDPPPKIRRPFHRVRSRSRYPIRAVRRLVVTMVAPQAEVARALAQFSVRSSVR